MLRLVVSAPNKQKVELELNPSNTFGDVKAGIASSLGVPQDKQRLLCNGKERKDAKETLEAAGVSAKSKLMLMLMPGYTMPVAPGSSSGSIDSAAEAVEADDAPPAVELTGELPLVLLEESPPPVESGRCAVIHVRQGRNRFHVRCPQGLEKATFGQLADFLSAEMLSGGVPSSELRFLFRGKTPARADCLGNAGAKDSSAMLIFHEGFHVAAEGSTWLRESSAELAHAEGEVAKLGKRIEGNLIDAETTMQLAEATGIISTLRQSVDTVRVRELSLPEMQKFRERVLAADARLEELKKLLHGRDN